MIICLMDSSVWTCFAGTVLGLDLACDLFSSWRAWAVIDVGGYVLRYMLSATVRGY